MDGNSRFITSAVSKAMRRLMPIFILMYTLSILDRVNVGFAKQGLQLASGISDAAFAFGAGVFFVGYALFEIPSNIIMSRVGSRIWLTRIMVTWGLISAAMMFVNSEVTFYALRFALGIAEAGFYPGVLLALTYWFPTAARGQANGALVFGFALSLIIGGPLSGLLLELHDIGGLLGWQWMFLIEGLMASAAGIICFFYLDNRPIEAKWLTSEEKRALIEILEIEDKAKSTGSPRSIWHALFNTRVLYFSLVFLLVQIAAYGLIFYLPTQISQLIGEKVGAKVGLLVSIPWTVAAVATYIITRWSDRNKHVRQLTVSCLYIVFGICVILSIHSTPTLAIVALAIGASAYLSGNPLFFTFVSEKLSAVSMAAGVALINSLGNLGGFFSPSLKTAVEAYFSSTAAGLNVLGAVAILAGLLIGCMPTRLSDAKGRLAQVVQTSAT